MSESLNEDQIKEFYNIIKPKEYRHFDEVKIVENGWVTYESKGFVKKNDYYVDNNKLIDLE